MATSSSSVDRSIRSPVPKNTAKLLLTDYNNPADCFRALFNPTELEVSVSVNSGVLAPIGWSNGIKQYASTGLARFPLRLWFSSVAMLYWPPIGDRTWGQNAAGREWTDVRDPLDWLSQFCYAKAPGLAPSPLHIYWPNTMCIAATVDEYRHRISMWDQNGIPRVAEVTLDLTEYKDREFLDADTHYNRGWLQRNPRRLDGR